MSRPIPSVIIKIIHSYQAEDFFLRLSNEFSDWPSLRLRTRTIHSTEGQEETKKKFNLFFSIKPKNTSYYGTILTSHKAMRGNGIVNCQILSPILSKYHSLIGFGMSTSKNFRNNDSYSLTLQQVDYNHYSKLIRSDSAETIFNYNYNEFLISDESDLATQHTLTPTKIIPGKTKISFGKYNSHFIWCINDTIKFKTEHLLGNKRPIFYYIYFNFMDRVDKEINNLPMLKYWIDN